MSNKFTCDQKINEIISIMGLNLLCTLLEKIHTNILKILLLHIPSLSWIRISALVECTTLGFVENKKNPLKSSSPSSVSSSMMAISTD